MKHTTQTASNNTKASLSWNTILNDEAAIAQTTRDIVNATLIVSIAVNVITLSVAVVLMA
ncbi:hypothetical protein FJZ39_02775 [Candidatus Saccharibacteria bacterium]|nr:hypothetical protein [Candidatus Saccharibacteria bacterium]